jgi:hypothetical protein
MLGYPLHFRNCVRCFVKILDLRKGLWAFSCWFDSFRLQLGCTGRSALLPSRHATRAGRRRFLLTLALLIVGAGILMRDPVGGQAVLATSNALVLACLGGYRICTCPGLAFLALTLLRLARWGCSGMVATLDV